MYRNAHYFADAPRPLMVAGASRLQLKPGVLIGAVPQWRIHGWEAPRIGIGCRFAGDLSGWHLVISTPF